MNCYAVSHCESLPILRVGNRARAQAASREFMSGGGRRSHPSVDPYPTLAPRPPSAPNTEGPNWTGAEGTARGGGGGRADHLNHLVGSRSESEGLRGKLAALAFYPLAPFPPSFLPIDVIVVDVFPLIFHSLFFSLDSDTRSIERSL